VSPKFFSSSQDILNLSTENLRDAYLVQGLMLKLQVIPLTKQLTTLSGNLWSKTIRGARAERIEYLLLHEFYALKYILPEKKPFDNKKASHAMVVDEDAAMEADNDEGGPVGKVGGTSRKRAKAAYAGGLVLEPKKGLYDTYILLLDFNSLYPSIIQEYNLCFTTVAWTKYMFDGTESKQVEDSNKKATGSSSSSKKAVTDNADEDSGNEDSVKGDEPDPSNTKSLPPYPDSSSHPGVLPRVIKNLVDRRRSVKDLLKKERDPAVRQQLDIRQKALKLTANSMYGCLGFSFSRFYARPIAAMVTAMGREALQRTVDLATNQLSLDVIYGDTDSVMINTNLTDLKSVKEIGLSVKKEVNKLYRSLELELDGIFKSMLLLKKKKYAAVVINEGTVCTVHTTVVHRSMPYPYSIPTIYLSLYLM
jgi:DNA polymerase alpha subunit A